MANHETETETNRAPLAGYRVLDFTDQRGEIGTWLLAELGADVIKVEPPAGNQARLCLPTAPLGSDFDSSTQSLQFGAYNSNKRSIALDLAGGPGQANPADRETLEALVANADFVYSSEPEGVLSGAGYCFSDLTALNPTIVHVEVTPFGADGPRCGDPYSELTLAALGGVANLQGSAERPPVKASIPQVWRHAGTEAANAGLVAHARRLATDQPQHAVVSAQSAITWTLLNAMEAHGICGEDVHRTGTIVMLSAPLQLRLEAKDGYSIAIARGAFVGGVLEWLIEEGLADPSWRDEDWQTIDIRMLEGEESNYSYEEMFEAVSQLCARHDRDFLMRKALKYRETIAPVFDVADLLELDHLDSREFWTELEPAQLKSAQLKSVRVPGAPATIDGQRIGGHRQPPRLDEHGDQIRRELAHLAAANDGTHNNPTNQTEAVAGTQYGSPELPLAGIKVADFSWIGVGPITAKALADHGATVVRVECGTRLDGLRINPPFKDNVFDVDMSHFYGTFNTSKLSIDIDMAVPEGLEIAKAMIAWADVVIESWRPGSFAAAGLDDATITDLNPNVILVHTSLLASGGPLSGLAGYGYHAAAIAGFYPVVGWPDMPPDGPYLAYTDTISPRFITATLLSALDQRRRTGRGCVIEAAQLECGLQFLAPELAHYQLTGHVAGRNGNRDADVAPQGVYPCKGEDRWCAVTVATDEQWQALVELLGSPDWACKPELESLEGRQVAHDVIDEHLASWTAGFEPQDLEETLLAAQIPAGVVQRSSDLLADRQYEHSGFYRYLEHERMGVVPYAGHQYKIDGYDHGPRAAAPTLGQHTFQVLTEQLGMSPDQIAAAAEAGALG